MVCRLFAGGNRIRTIGPALVKGLSAVADERCQTDKLDGVIKHRSSRETTMVGRGGSLDGRLFLGGTGGSNPVPSSKESVTNLTGKIEPALARNRRFESSSLQQRVRRTPTRTGAGSWFAKKIAPPAKAAMRLDTAETPSWGWLPVRSGRLLDRKVGGLCAPLRILSTVAARRQSS